MKNATDVVFLVSLVVVTNFVFVNSVLLSQEPPPFNKPPIIRNILGSRSGNANSGYGYSGRNDRRSGLVGPAKAPVVTLAKNPIDQSIANDANLTVGSGIRQSAFQEPPVRGENLGVQPIDDPFGDLLSAPQKNSFLNESGQNRGASLVAKQNPSGNRGDGRSSINDGTRVAVVQPRLVLSAPRQDSILRKPTNLNPLPNSRLGSQKTILQDAPSVQQDAPSVQQDAPSVQPDVPESQAEIVEPTPDASSNRSFPGGSLGDSSSLRQQEDDLRQQTYELNCREINGVMLKRSVKDIALKMGPQVESGKSIPQFCSFEGIPAMERQWLPQDFNWTASAVCSKPLDFQHIQLERYGHSRGPVLQPIFSAAHFFGNVAINPYKVGIHPPNECIYALGYYRPGDCAPWLREPFPLSVKGAASQALYTIGYSAILR